MNESGYSMSDVVCIRVGLRCIDPDFITIPRDKKSPHLAVRCNRAWELMMAEVRFFFVICI